jgi:glycerophosphoryl diester phosphodiesterase
MELGMDALELDVVISSDKKVVVAHEPYMPHDICQKPDGTSITEAEEKSLNLYQMSYEEIRMYNCGLKHPRFEEQMPEPVHRPLLSELFSVIEAHWKSSESSPILYTIELKSAPEFDGSYHPNPAEFVSLVLDAIREAGTLERCILQSFDMRILREIHTHEPDANLSLLLDHEFDLTQKLRELSFVPQFLGPKFTLVNEALINACKERLIKVVPWTVNEVSDMEHLIDLGVDGIITDYPNRKKLVRG